MSSLRNAVKRITHKERSQPQSRSHLGILEKKKDYVARAQDYHKKEKRIKSMRTKVSNRNPDEFYFNMHKSQVVDGRHKKTDESQWEERKELVGAEAVKIMKSQDLSYVRMQRQKDLKSLEKLKRNLHFIGHLDGDDDDDDDKNKKKRKHTIFVNNQKEAKTFDVAQHFDTVPEMAGRAFNRPRISTLTKLTSPANHDDNDDDSEDDKEEPTLLSKKQRLNEKQKRRRDQKILKTIAKSKSRSYAELEFKTKRMNTLKTTEDVLMNERNLAAKGRKRMVKEANLEEGTPAVYRWRRKRSR